MSRDPGQQSLEQAVEAPPVVFRDPGLSWGMKILLFFLNLMFFPGIVGLVWYLAIRDVKPRTARSVARVTKLSVAIYVMLILGAMMAGLLIGSSP